jgi:hypothetical protein
MHDEFAPTEVPFAILLAAVFVTCFVVALRFGLGTGAWFAQAVDVIAAPMTLLAILLALVMPRVGDTALRAMTRLTALRSPFLPLALAVLPLFALGTVLVVGVIPIAADELVPIFQARLFASFEAVAHYDPLLLDAAIPPVSQGVFVLVSPQGDAMSVYFPGQALLLTPFVWLGVPWLIGPVFGALGVYLIGRLGTTLINRTAGVFAMILALASGQFVMTALTPFPEGVHLTLSVAFLWLIVLGRPHHFLLAGLVGGLALALKNPFPHVLIALPWVLWLLVDSVRRRNLVPLIAGYVPGLVVIAAWLVLQNQLTPPSFHDEGGFWISKLGDIVELPTLFTVLVRFLEVVSAWSWSAPGLLVLAVIGWLRTDDQRVKLLGASFCITVVGYLFFPDQQGLGYGARYFHPAWGALPILGAAALIGLRNLRLTRFVFAAAVLSLVLVLPLHMFYGHLLNERRAEPLMALAAPGVDLYFVRFQGRNGVSETVLANDLAGTDEVVLVSQGDARDQQVVDRWFRGSRLVTKNEWGAGYARP